MSVERFKGHDFGFAVVVVFLLVFYDLGGLEVELGAAVAERAV